MEEQTVIYRLSQIEKSLEELKELIVSVKLNEKDIQDLSARLDKVEGKVESVEDSVRELQSLPNKNGSEKWNFIVDYVFKFAVTGAVAYIATKFFGR